MRYLITVIAVLCLAGCFTPSLTAKNYNQAVSEYGQPDDCHIKKETGHKYCSWSREKVPALDYNYRLVIEFDKDGNVIRNYNESVLGDKD